MKRPNGVSGPCHRDTLRGPVARYVYDSLAPFTSDDTFLVDLLSRVEELGIVTADDVTNIVTRGTLKDLDLPMSVKTTIQEFYTSKVQEIPVFGEVRGELTRRPPRIWQTWRSMLADVFFFFEYLYEDGSGALTPWPAATRGKRVCYRHTVNPRLYEEDKIDYDGRIAIKDTKGHVRVELLRTRRMGAMEATKEMRAKLRSESLTQSQAAWVKRNIIWEEMQDLQRKAESGDERVSVDEDSDDSTLPDGGDDGDGGREREEGGPTETKSAASILGDQKESTNGTSTLALSSGMFTMRANPLVGHTTPSGTNSTDPSAHGNRKCVLEALRTFDKKSLRDSSTSITEMAASHVPPVVVSSCKSKSKEMDDACNVAQGSSSALDGTGSMGRKHWDAKGDSEWWECPRCTLRNQHWMSACEVCFHLKPSSKTHGNAWSCRACTYINEDDVIRCAICESAKPVEIIKGPVNPSNRSGSLRSVRSGRDARNRSSFGDSADSSSTSTRHSGGHNPVGYSRAQSMPVLWASEPSRSPYSTQGPLEDDELVVRFFGMKDCDGSTVCYNMKFSKITSDPFTLRGDGKSVDKHRPDPRGFKVHSGFWRMLKQINAGCIKRHGVDLVQHICTRAGIDPSRRIIFTGHSMGGALAAYEAFRLVTRYPHLKQRLFVVIMGAPKFCRYVFAKWFEKEMEGRIIHIVLDGDPTPKLPPRPFFGWYCPGVRVHISPKRLHKQWGRKLDENDLNVHFQYWQILRTILVV